ncbi:MAG TPA: hypothetical protein VLX32_02350 [Candidatus Acidoferrum sp.]|nr:hypothetical protein [Candidatus Acidoferrum sp.]
MPLKEAYLEDTLQEVEELAGRVNLLKSLLAKRSLSEKLEQHWDLESVRSRFAEYKRRVEELEEAPEEKIEISHDAAEHAWQDLRSSVDTLLEEVA